MGLSPLTAAQGLHMPESGCEYEDSRRRHAVEVPWPRINANGEVRPPQCITSTANLAAAEAFAAPQSQLNAVS